MATIGRIIHAKSGQTLLTQVQWCRSYFCKFMGLQFRRSLAEGEGLLFVESRPSKIDTTIHMFFVLMPIAVIWMNPNFEVVDKVLAKPWRPVYTPAKPAQYFLEADPSLLEQAEIGDVLRFEA